MRYNNKEIIVITDDEMKILKKHYYGNKAFTTDEMLDLWHDIVEQIVEPVSYTHLTLPTKA